MAEPPFDLASAHRWFGIELNNRIMDALEAGRVTPETGESFIHAAHARCHHWMQVGTVANHRRGEFAVASAYAAVRGLENWLRGQARSAIGDYLPAVTARIGEEPGRVFVMGQRTRSCIRSSLTIQRSSG